MTDRRISFFNQIELAERAVTTGKKSNEYYAQVHRRRNNNQGIIENPLGAFLTVYRKHTAILINIF